MAEGVIDGSVRAVLSLGGNLVRAMPDIARVEAAWGGLDLVVNIATKLNRTHLVPGRATYLLPCLVRAEEDEQTSGPQYVSVEDSLSHIHASLGTITPAAPSILSEPTIVAGIAKATLAPNPKVRWDDWIADYARIRALIEETWPEMFRDYETRMHAPGGFYKGNKARERVWKTDSGKAEFIVPNTLYSGKVPDAPGRYRLITMRSNDPDYPMKEYAVEIVTGITEKQAEIDEIISTYSEGWTLDRMPAVDRSLLEIGTWEMLFNVEVPDKVAIDEAVSLARQFSTDDSPGFVSGLLSRILDVKPTLI